MRTKLIALVIVTALVALAAFAATVDSRSETVAPAAPGEHRAQLLDINLAEGIECGQVLAEGGVARADHYCSRVDQSGAEDHCQWITPLIHCYSIIQHKTIRALAWQFATYPSTEAALRALASGWCFALVNPWAIAACGLITALGMGRFIDLIKLTNKHYNACVEIHTVVIPQAPGRMPVEFPYYKKFDGDWCGNYRLKTKYGGVVQL